MASEQKDKPKKPKKEKAVEAPAPRAEKPPEAPRPPADPRLKVIKKLGRLLPKGELRDRKKALMTRWNSGDDHGGVTYDELKALHNDWKASREKKPRPTPASA